MFIVCCCFIAYGLYFRSKEFKSNNRKSVIDGFFGMAIGLVVALAVGGLVEILF